MFKKRIVYYILFLFLFIDFGYSFLQYYNTPMDGDMAGGIVPAHNVKDVLNCPLGIKVFIENRTYPNPNRFFSHWAFYSYFNCIPQALQTILEPIDSAYFSCALIKSIIQVLMIFMLSVIVVGWKDLFRFNFVYIAIIFTSFFQTNGYRAHMGIIDTSTTYTFFYALPLLFLLVYFFPLFYNILITKKIAINKWWYLLIPLSIPISLSGPLNSGIALIISLLFFIRSFYSNIIKLQSKGLRKIVDSIVRIPNYYYIFLIPVSVLSLYSLYLGRFNSIGVSYSITILEMYSQIPKGLFYQFFQDLGFPVIFLIIILNIFLIKRLLNSTDGQSVISVIKWLIVFSILYIILLPLGGYRNYRPNILRYDSILPVTISLLFVYTYSTYYIIKRISRKHKFWYIPLIIIVVLIFTNSDRPEFDKNNCEREALVKIQNSNETYVRLDCDCNVLSWEKIDKPVNSNLKAQLLERWNITNKKKLYYHSLKKDSKP